MTTSHLHGRFSPSLDWSGVEEYRPLTWMHLLQIMLRSPTDLPEPLQPILQISGRLQDQVSASALQFILRAKST
jgi:hypothetical protein